MNNNFSNFHFFNKTIDKSELKTLITWAFRNYGIARASNMVDRLKDLGFYYATKAGISLSLEDLRIPPSKSKLLYDTVKSISITDHKYRCGNITAVERFQKIIDIWNYASETLKSEVIEYFKNTDPLNSIYMMAFSGARANISQVRQLVGMRGLMSDPQGQIIDLPISSNFREGLTITDYFISSYGARKGLVDTALRTADSGYLTRRLVDVAQDIIVREYDCKTTKGILLEEMIDNQKTLIKFQQALLGRVLAEDIINPKSNLIIAKSGQSIDPQILDKILTLNMRNILVRSPLTCASIKSVCQLCYGWNLAHGKIVDLGEAIGIIAAQSIGEPGTQLTMRTFHTGGVFTGELSQNIISPIDGILNYDVNLNLTKTRTRHGDYAMIVNSDSKVKIIQNDNDFQFVSLSKGSLLLANNQSSVTKGQIIGEYHIVNKFATEKAQKVIVADFSGSIHFSNYYNKNKKLLNDIKNVVKNNIVIWILSGRVHNIPKETKLLVYENDKISKNSLLARTELLSKSSGRIYLIKDNNLMISNKLLLVTSSKLYTNFLVSVYSHQDYKKYFLEINNKEKFFIKCEPNKKLINNQIISDLISDVYKTKTGGIIKYLDVSVNRVLHEDNSKNIYEINGSGYILWISEETHIINKDASLLLVQHGQFVEIGTEIIQNVFANNSGIIEILEKEGIVREIVIKPGTLYLLDKNFNIKYNKKSRGFLRPSEILFNLIKTNKLSYWEHMQVLDKNYILLRPVIIYSVPKKNLIFKYSDNSFNKHIVNLKLIRRTDFNDGERVKSILGVNLVSIHLMLQLPKSSSNLKCYMQLEPFNNKKLNLDRQYYYLKFITADILYIRDNDFSNNEDFYKKVNILVKNNDYITSNSIIAQTDIFSKLEGYIKYIQKTKTSTSRILIVSKLDIKTFYINNNQNAKVKLYDWVHSGDCIATNLFVNCSGQVIELTKNEIVIRIGQPYLISSGSFLHMDNNNLIKRGENIATLIFEKFKTGDIVQGLPRIEEILEARKKIDKFFNPHMLLETKFLFYRNQGLSIINATRLSIIEIQLLLIKEIQIVYQSQGVDIADKHIEIIVKQMTSKVKVENGGDSDYLPGEIVDLQKIESINKSLSIINKNPALYQPILLGITKASLNTDSFISAASFQETTKVLTDAAISGKLDWLRGLKENVIIGRLIPAGTGFNMYNNSIKNNDIYNKIIKNQNIGHHTNKSNDDLSSSFINNFDDIIVDDRNIQNRQSINY